MGNNRRRLSGFPRRSRSRRQRRQPFLDLPQLLLQRINPPDQLRRFRLRRTFHRIYPHVRNDSQRRHTNHEKGGDQDEQRGA